MNTHFSKVNLGQTKQAWTEHLKSLNITSNQTRHKGMLGSHLSFGREETYAAEILWNRNWR